MLNWKNDSEKKCHGVLGEIGEEGKIVEVF